MPPPVNLANHVVYHLAGSGILLEQGIAFNYPFYLTVDSTLLPTGEILSVHGAHLDFSVFKPMGSDMARLPGVYYCCLVVDKSGDLSLLCTARDHAPGRMMEIRTIKPGVQLYTGYFFDGSLNGQGRLNSRHGAFTLKTQYFPESVNINQFFPASCALVKLMIILRNTHSPGRRNAPGLHKAYPVFDRNKVCKTATPCLALLVRSLDNRQQRTIHRPWSHDGNQADFFHGRAYSAEG
jgi:hypothetical protein